MDFIRLFAKPMSPQELCIINKPIPWYEPFHLWQCILNFQNGGNSCGEDDGSAITHIV